MDLHPVSLKTEQGVLGNFTYDGSFYADFASDDGTITRYWANTGSGQDFTITDKITDAIGRASGTKLDGEAARLDTWSQQPNFVLNPLNPNRCK